MIPLAITGLGVVSPIGIGREAFRAALCEADPAARAFGAATVFDPAVVPAARVAEVWDFDATEYLGPKGLRNFDRLTRFLIVAGKLALRDAGLERDGQRVGLSPEDIGICSATAYGSLDAITELNRVAELEDPRYINPARFPNTVINAAAGYVSIWEDLRAPNTTVVDGNCGALDAVLTCETHLAHRRGEAFLVGGGEVLSEPLYLAMGKLGVLGGEGTAGLTPGEGAAYFCVERVADARARGARVLATIDGYGTAFEPPASEARLAHASAPSVRRAVGAALRDAGIGPGDVDVVASAQSGQVELDAAELAGLSEALGDVAVAAPKRFLGESFGGAGALGVATALAWMDGAPVGPMVCGSAPARVDTVVVDTVGFYGNVSAVVLRRAERGA